MLKLEKFPNISQYAVYTHPYRLCIYYANFFWESTNENANLSLGTGMGFSYCVHLIIKPKTWQFWVIKVHRPKFSTGMHSRVHESWIFYLLLPSIKKLSELFADLPTCSGSAAKWQCPLSLQLSTEGIATRRRSQSRAEQAIHPHILHTCNHSLKKN